MCGGVCGMCTVDGRMWLGSCRPSTFKEKATRGFIFLYTFFPTRARAHTHTYTHTHTHCAFKDERSHWRSEGASVRRLLVQSWIAHWFFDAFVLYYTHTHYLCVCVSMYMYICTYIHVCKCMHLCVYIYMYIIQLILWFLYAHTRTHTRTL
jgi:hypothetical protein